MVWHPRYDDTVLAGCANGNIYMIRLSMTGQDHVICHDHVPGFIHLLSFLIMPDTDEVQLVIAYGVRIGVVVKPFSHRALLLSLYSVIYLQSTCRADLSWTHDPSSSPKCCC
jgi:hypothetical protein